MKYKIDSHIDRSLILQGNQKRKWSPTEKYVASTTFGDALNDSFSKWQLAKTERAETKKREREAQKSRETKKCTIPRRDKSLYQFKYQSQSARRYGFLTNCKINLVLINFFPELLFYCFINLPQPSMLKLSYFSAFLLSHIRWLSL